MKHVDLFSGIGGFALAAQWAGYETVLFCDNDPWCQQVLRKHWPDVPIIGDIRDVTKETVADAERQPREAKAGQGRQEQEFNHGLDIRNVDNPRGSGRPVPGTATQTFPPIDLLTGGFPCQPFSVAGKRGGSDDNRYLWPEMLRVIAELQPCWVLGENVAGIINMALDDVLSDLEGEGYETQAFVIPTCAVNAPHRRDRVWIVAHSNGGLGTRQARKVRARRNTPNSSREDVADTDDERCQQRINLAVASDAGQLGRGIAANVAHSQRTRLEGWDDRRDIEPHVTRLGQGCGPKPDWWKLEPDVGRVAHGIPRRVDRLRGLGNAIVPQVAYQIIKTMRQE